MTAETTASRIAEETREALAAYAHQAWSGWMAYLFEKSTANPDGTVTIPAWAVERWRRQVATAYTDLPEAEKDSDRVEAETILVTLRKAVKEAKAYTRGAADEAIELYYRRRAAGTRTTLRAVAEERGFNYSYLRARKAEYDTRGGWGSKRAAAGEATS